MKTVLCPTRGGEASLPNQDRAIAIAVEKGARLVFLYISNVHFLDHLTSTGKVEMVEEQLDELGEFVLEMARERAEKAGVEAMAIVSRGGFLPALEEAIAEYEVDLVVLGSASQGTGITTPGYRRDLIQHLVKTHAVEVVLTAVGEVVEHHRPE